MTRARSALGASSDSDFSFPLAYLLPLLPSPIAAAAQNSDYDSAAGFTGDSCQLLSVSVSVSVQVPVAALSLVSVRLSLSVCQSPCLSVTLSVCLFAQLFTNSCQPKNLMS